jgi:hypothetical protein
MGDSATGIHGHFLLLLVLLAPVQASASPVYHFTELAAPSFFSEFLRVSSSGTPYLSGVPALIGGFYAQDVNSSGVYAGTCLGNRSGASFSACTLDPIHGEVRIPFPAPTSTASLAYATDAYDINDRGDVLGGATSVNGGNVNIGLQIYTQHGDLIDLGISSYRRPNLNNNWEVVGAAYTVGAGRQDSFYYYDGHQVPLQSLVADLGSFLLLVPTDINNDGFIVGYGRNEAGENRGFLLSPQRPIPEPTPLAMIFTELLLACGAVRWRRLKRSNPRPAATRTYELGSGTRLAAPNAVTRTIPVALAGPPPVIKETDATPDDVASRLSSTRRSRKSRAKGTAGAGWAHATASSPLRFIPEIAAIST